MDLRHAAVSLQQAAQEKFGVKAKIKTGRSGDMSVSVDGQNVFAYKAEGSMPKIEELLRRRATAQRFAVRDRCEIKFALFLFRDFISNRVHETSVGATGAKGRAETGDGRSMNILFWIIFNAAILVLLFLDLAVWNRGGRVIPFKQALLNSACWIALALGFAVFIRYWLSPAKSLEFITGYLVEEALSVDNLFVFLLLFSYFKVPPEQERTVLFWGIIGALIMRGVFIFAGVALVQRFHWVLYLFGAFLIYSGFKLMAEGEGEEIDPSRNVVLRFARKMLPVSDHYEGNKFLVRRE